MKNILIIVLVISTIILSGCSVQSIADTKTESNVGKTVKVTGTVESTFKLGSLSGYILKDDSGTISVSSESLPAEGEKKTVNGVLIKDTIFGYYIKVE